MQFLTSLTLSLLGLIWPLPFLHRSSQASTPYRTTLLLAIILVYRFTLLFYAFHRPLNKPMIYFVTACYFVFTSKDIVLLVKSQPQTKQTFTQWLYRYLIVRNDWLVTPDTAKQVQSYNTRVMLILPKLLLVHYVIMPYLHSFDHISCIECDTTTLIKFSYAFALFVYSYIDVISDIVLLPYTLIAPTVNKHVFNIDTPVPEVIRPLWPYWFAPMFSTSVFDFWSVNWHQMIAKCSKDIAYKPVRGLTNSRGLALMSVFLWSGVFHQIALFYTTYDTHWHDASQIIFFLLHGLLCAVELSAQSVAPQLQAYIPKPLKMAYVQSVMALTACIAMQPFAQLKWTRELPSSIIPI